MTMASTGWSAVGSGPASAGQIVVAAPLLTRRPARRCWSGRRGRRRGPCRPRRRAPAGTGRAVGHQAQARPATSAAATQRGERPADGPALRALQRAGDDPPDQPHEHVADAEQRHDRGRRSPAPARCTPRKSPSAKFRDEHGGSAPRPTPRPWPAGGAATAPSGASRRASAAPRRAPRAVTTTRAQVFRAAASRLPPAARQQALQDRADPLVEVGDAGDVGQHVVAVEAQHRRQLPDHLQHLRGHDQQQRVPAGEPPRRRTRAARRAR